MMNFAKGTNIFELKVDDMVFVKTGFCDDRTGYFGIVKNIEQNRCYDSNGSPYDFRKICIYSPLDGSTNTFYATSDISTYQGITKIPKDLWGRHVIFCGDLVKVVYVDIYHKPYCIKVLNEKTGLDKWVTLDKFFELDWREEEVRKVRTAEMFKEFKNKTYYEMTRDVKIVSMYYRDDFENLEKGDRIVLKKSLYCGESLSLACVDYTYIDTIRFKGTNETHSYTINHISKTLLNYRFLKVPSSIKAGNTLWYEGNPAIIVKTPVLMSDGYMFSVEVFETAYKHMEVPVNVNNFHKCVFRNVNNKLKEAEKTEKMFKGVEFNMDARMISDIIRQNRETFKKSVNEKHGLRNCPEDQIIITTDGVKITYARCGDLVASSRCHDDDTFDPWTGAKIALERLEKKFIEKAERDKKEKILNNWYDSLTEEKKAFIKKKLQEDK